MFYILSIRVVNRLLISLLHQNLDCTVTKFLQQDDIKKGKKLKSRTNE